MFDVNILSNNAVCSGGTNLALPIWAIAAIIVGGLLLLGLLIIVAVKLVLFWLVYLAIIMLIIIVEVHWENFQVFL